MNDTEMTWRKLPRNIIRDENLLYISDMLPPELKAAPLLFYMVALSLADNDGIFDIEDGVIFSRLMRMGTPQDVFTIANLFLKRRIILRAGNSTKLILTNWEYSIKDKSRSIEDRRAIVAKKIEAEQRQADSCKTFESIPAPDEDIINVDFSTYDPNSADFFCPKNDKTKENVVITKMDDKIQENVVKKLDTEKIREDKNREIEREEHTQIRETREIRETQDFRANLTALQPCGIESSRETTDTKELQEAADRLSLDNSSEELVDQAIAAQSEGMQYEKESRTFQALSVFFAKNCLGFKAIEHEEALVILTSRMNELADEKNPSEIVASVMTSQFKQLTETSKYYTGYAITPENMLKPGAYSHTLAAASKILMNNKTQDKWIENFNKYADEYKQELEVGNGLESTYVNLGIDPNDPARIAKMLAGHREQGINSA